MSNQNYGYPRDGAPKRPRNENYPRPRNESGPRPRNEELPKPRNESYLRPRNEANLEKYEEIYNRSEKYTKKPKPQPKSDGGGGASKPPVNKNAAGGKKRKRRKKGARLFKAVIARTILFVLIAILISSFIISVADDAFALTKTDATEITVSIPDGASTKEIAKILKKNKLIKYEFAYVIYAKMTKEDGTAKFGDFVFTYDMTYDNIMTTLKRGSFSETNPNDVRITIPEGYECAQIVDLLVEKGLGTKETFDDVINNHNFGYNFIDKIPQTRTGYRLEGYLFPDTYIFSKTEGEVSIIKRMLLNFDRKITVELYDRMNEIGYTLDQTITLASIIEREAGTLSDMPLISSVFHNRLNSDYKYLESDATIQFVLGERKNVLSYEDTELDNPYNTYKYAGLTPGPIASPGLAAIKAALYPEDTSYFYFVARGDGTSMFAETYDEHQKNVTVASRTWKN